jgi:hypothetical protein
VEYEGRRVRERRRGGSGGRRARTQRQGLLLLFSLGFLLLVLRREWKRERKVGVG